MKLLISPIVTETDYLAMKESLNISDYIKGVMDRQFHDFLSGDKITIASSQLLLMLIEKGNLEVKVAIPKDIPGLFHEKVGIFKDTNGNIVSILGSNNETKLAVTKNHESFHVFCNWIQGQEIFCEQNESDFDEYWNKRNENLNIYSLEESVSKHVLKQFETGESIDDLYGIITIDEDPKPQDFLPFSPYDYQKAAVKAWLNGYQGIFKFATGAGKTKTAIYLMHLLKEIREKNIFLIVVPDKTLVYQWSQEIKDLGYSVLQCFSDNSKWFPEFNDIVDIYNVSETGNDYIVSSIDTFFSDRFQKVLQKLNNDYLLVGDECHTFGTEKKLHNAPKPDRILGLSATPELFFSESKTNRLLEYFGGIIYEYGLQEAIADEKLLGYTYHPIEVSLNLDEKDRYRELTHRIVKLIGHDVDSPSDAYDKALEMLLFKRARIVYGAVEKLHKLKTLLPELESNRNLLIYCGATSYDKSFQDDSYSDSITQLKEVNITLKNLDIPSAQYTQSESGRERQDSIKLFQAGTLKTLVAIKCLDEGVNIPEIERAIILSSSTNPREFIQRRGRLLRTHKNKTHASIYDMVVLDFEQGFEGINRKELERVFEFSKIAMNKEDLIRKYSRLFDTYLEKRGNLNE
ncbi:DEAD/DEAH box helicase family protein [Candidatus Xianfuyuplasma coldseepsis]|uniref:DEAD/DEAH box helicase family protein n=1 Tax=Candidatus Xianfuyuplasma coldseepsis TaxID=2782163 RepID=A0A7L7KQM5_9MOLU|nr:DEAD/DEAH box helicase family protein [Xianfuyuplasma coldseepsis]QMS85111.1 DEAD/DEAH box helicase family protein [Xianfuyuplasma coldseepsis]